MRLPRADRPSGWLVDRTGATKTKCIGLTTILPACVLISLDFQSCTTGKVAVVLSLLMIGFGGNLVITALMTEFGQIAREVESVSSTDDIGARRALARSYSFFTVTVAIALLIGSLTAQAVVDTFSWSVLYIGLAILIAILDLAVVSHIDSGLAPLLRRLLCRSRSEGTSSANLPHGETLSCTLSTV